MNSSSVHTAEIPKISVIVPNYNHAPFLPKRLETIFNQTFQDFEVILLDDGSTDESLEILKQYCDHPKVSHYMFEDENSGLPFKQWEKGIRVASGQYIWIAESDDWAELNFLEELVPKLDAGAGVAFCKSHTYYESEKKLSSYYYPEDLYPAMWRKNKQLEGQYLLENFHVHVNTIPNASACLFRKNLVEFDDDILDMNFCGDWLFWACIMQKTDVYFLAEKLNYWRLSAQTTRQKKAKYTEEKRYSEGILCIQKICALCGKGDIDVAKYDWLFLNYFSQISTRRVLFLEKPEIPVEGIQFRLYVIRSAIYLWIKNAGKYIFRSKKVSS